MHKKLIKMNQESWTLAKTFAPSNVQRARRTARAGQDGAGQGRRRHKQERSLAFHMTWSPTAEKGESFACLAASACAVVFDDEFSGSSSCKIMQMRRQLAAAFEFLTTE